ncbi:MAG: hypothetical protein WA667_24295 [Candidatus Nitrosopolaris sp.]
MTSIAKNQKTANILVAIAALAAVLVGSGHMAFADNGNDTKVFNNTAINVQTDTNQKTECKTTGETSPISGSCTAASTNNVAQSGGILHK